ncbi:MAG: 4-hydroxythreonine-4-phosphate dehydrogenase PdxA [Deltaproteobacteria bacterium]|nr:4-hydroxythreonine-4-phosphate dehydrogenase PdxA [Deltaproteobacteria bacterium]
MSIPRIALTMGDPAGVGPEIVLAAIVKREILSRMHLVVVGDVSVLERCSQEVFSRELACRDEGQLCFEHVAEPGGDFPLGQPSAASGKAAAAYVHRACQLALAGEVDAICTAPIHKVALRAAGCPHVDHTSMLGAHFGVAEPMTLFITAGLRIFFLSRHLSLRDAVDAISVARTTAFLRQAFGALRDLGLERPHLALAALNPHAGDDGRFGSEEQEHLRPAVEVLRGEGELISGPIPADAVFHQAAQGAFDAVVALYHDQGHIAAKTLDFHGTIAATLGLPIPRLSVDHGTAMDIAWQGKANPQSLLLALDAAVELAQGRLPRRPHPL